MKVFYIRSQVRIVISESLQHDTGRNVVCLISAAYQVRCG